MSRFEPPFGRAFERAFLATRYVLGARGDALFTGLSAPSEHAKEWAAKLSHTDRRARADALGVALGHVTRSLYNWRIR